MSLPNTLTRLVLSPLNPGVCSPLSVVRNLNLLATVQYSHIIASFRIPFFIQAQFTIKEKKQSRRMTLSSNSLLVSLNSIIIRTPPGQVNGGDYVRSSKSSYSGLQLRGLIPHMVSILRISPRGRKCAK